MVRFEYGCLSSPSCTYKLSNQLKISFNLHSTHFIQFVSVLAKGYVIDNNNCIRKSQSNYFSTSSITADETCG